MDATRFDTVTRLFARRHRAKRAPGHLAQARPGAGLAARAQDPDGAPPDAETGPTMLFLQAFQAGSVVPKDGAEGRYVLTLEQGLGHTVYFSDRPHSPEHHCYTPGTRQSGR